MDDVPSIDHLDNVIEPFLDGDKLLMFKVRYLTKPGDNYGSILLAIHAEVETEIGEKQELQLVGKIPHLNNALLWEMFQPERTCRTENAIYNVLGPALHELQLERGIVKEKLFDGFAKYYGSRTSLDPKSKTVDKDALLLLENLQSSGFRAGNRHKMFDITHAKLVLHSLAQFHALPIALRHVNPKMFDQIVRSNFKRFNPNDGMTKEDCLQFEEVLYGDVTIATEGDERILQRVRALVKSLNEAMNHPENFNDPYSTIVHGDLWINNILIKYDENDKPVRVKLVDFQMSQCDSLVNDVIFFLFSSVDIFVLDNHFDMLIDGYHQSFTECLQSVGISTDNYSYMAFIKEVHTYAPTAIISALFMLRIILADQSALPDSFKDIDMEFLSKNDVNQSVIQRMSDVFRVAIKYKMFFDE